MTTATFFIATARSGTQWLTDRLRQVYSVEFVTEHEPIRYAYRPKLYLRGYDKLNELRALPAVSDHLDAIHLTLESNSYVEVGFPCYAMAPLLIREFGDRLRLVHLIRHPVRVAASVVTHHWYQDSRKDTLAMDIEPTPSDPGVVQTRYSDRWAGLSPYEKGLYYWTEVHLFGLEVQTRYPDVPFLTLKFEDLIDPPAALKRLAGFLGVDYREELAEKATTQVDRFHQTTSVAIDWTEIARHEQTQALAKHFGYDTASLDGDRLLERYGTKSEGSLVNRAVRKLKRFVRIHPHDS